MAWVTYNGPALTLSVRKRRATRGKAFPCSDPKELDFYKKRLDFSVVEPKKQKATAQDPASSTVEPAAPTSEPPVPAAPKRRGRRRAARSTEDEDA